MAGRVGALVIVAAMSFLAVAPDIGITTAQQRDALGAGQWL